MKIFSVLLIASIALVAGCVSVGDSMEKSAGAMENDTEAKNESAIMVKNSTSAFSEQGLTEFANNYYRYDPAAFQAARNDGKIILLDFHANWCGECKLERPRILSAMDRINYEDVVGFQVHYNDDQTKQFDTDIAREYQVPYQHTKIILGKDGRVLLKAFEIFDADRIINEINNARAV